MVVLVTGANGQLGQSLQFIADNYPQIDFVFCSSSELDITNLDTCKAVFSKYKPNYCINTAAYTAVDKAESETEKAIAINVTGAKNLALVCKEQDSVLLHVSTDFVFDGNKKASYTEDDVPNPTGVYGQTKLDGEKAIQEAFENYFIIRTSWVYSQFGNNFMKTMLRLASERDSLSVVNDQIGTPTNAVDLAEVLVSMVCHTERSRSASSNLQPPTSNLFGIYNFSNEGQCSWYDFAKKIFEFNGIKIDLKPIPTTSFPTPAKRPAYSVLDKSKIKNVFGIDIKNWEESLKTLIFPS
ncbi:MAG: dTDP-4-dehydrorhamnose reductase [Flavobacterium sp.]|uniref:dTDP-4-dehydrorhamnose reductase n=1 Tax=Flavobacterium sp. TaxID=239 RepID=UPI0022CBF542|nr:dTDP-4-dehydrorhamnose reductase [Flavobacterium sp.]MCZ8197447.1 dTDP-4-dehydrorhamnose reductase [Flavobacterium sp.]